MELNKFIDTVRTLRNKNRTAVIVAIAMFDDTPAFHFPTAMLNGEHVVANLHQRDLEILLAAKGRHVVIDTEQGRLRIPVEYIITVFSVDPESGNIDQRYLMYDPTEYKFDVGPDYGGCRLIKSIVGYQGNKAKIADELFTHIPKTTKRFFDVFGGSGVMAMTATTMGVQKVIYNDFDENIVNILKMIRGYNSAEEFEEVYDSIVEANKLAFPKKTPRNVEVAKHNYYRFKDIVNANKPLVPMHVFVLHKHAFCGLMRFSQREGNFNYAYGERRWVANDKRTAEIEACINALKQIKINRSNYKKFLKRILKNAKPFDFVYIDPPYLASGDNVYKGKWTEEDELELLKYLNKLNDKGIKFMVSNVLRHRDLVNKPLKDFINRNDWVHAINISSGKKIYSLSQITTDDVEQTLEVAVTNYKL